MFKITQSKGFHMTFENGYTISVQFGYGSYCDKYMVELKQNEDRECRTAEVAVLDNSGQWVTEEFIETDLDNPGVIGYLNSDSVAELIFKVKTYGGI